MKVNIAPAKDWYSFSGVAYSNWRAINISKSTDEVYKITRKGHFKAKSKVIGQQYGDLLFDDPLGYWK